MFKPNVHKNFDIELKNQDGFNFERPLLTFQTSNFKFNLFVANPISLNFFFILVVGGQTCQFFSIKMILKRGANPWKIFAYFFYKNCRTSKQQQYWMLKNKWLKKATGKMNWCNCEKRYSIVSVLFLSNEVPSLCRCPQT